MPADQVQRLLGLRRRLGDGGIRRAMLPDHGPKAWFGWALTRGLWPCAPSSSPSCCGCHARLSPALAPATGNSGLPPAYPLSQLLMVSV
jgi:hypothetical protein